jgi:hypothetical protein
MRDKLPLSILLAGLLAVVGTHPGRTDQAPPDATLKLKGNATFDFEQRRTTEDCEREGWKFKFDTKSVEFRLAWLGEGVDRRFFALKAEVWRIDESRGCYIGSSVERMEVSAFEPSKSSQAKPLYTVSIVPESHDQFADIALVETPDSFLKLYAGESTQESDFGNAAGPYRYYDLRNGKLLFFADQSGLVIERGAAGLDESARFIGITVPSEKQAGEYIANIVYASRSGVLQRAQISLSPGGPFLPDEQYPDISFLGADAPQVSISYDRIRGESAVTAMALFGIGVTRASDFEIGFALDRGVVATVPVMGDKLDLAHARMPAGFIITPIE